MNISKASVLVAHQNGANFVEVVQPGIPAFLLGPVILAAPHGHALSLDDISFVDDVWARAGNHLEVVVSDVGGAVDILQHVGWEDPTEIGRSTRNCAS